MAERETPSSHPSPGPTILVVEDEPVLRQLVTRILTKHGYHILSACDGEEALSVSRNFSGGIVLLVTDVEMPKLGGIELQARLSEQRPGIKTLFISGYSSDPFVQRALVCDQPGFLAKPFTITRLVAKVRQVLEGAGK